MCMCMCVYVCVCVKSDETSSCIWMYMVYTRYLYPFLLQLRISCLRSPFSQWPPKPVWGAGRNSVEHWNRWIINSYI